MGKRYTINYQVHSIIKAAFTWVIYSLRSTRLAGVWEFCNSIASVCQETHAKDKKLFALLVLSSAHYL